LLQLAKSRYRSANIVGALGTLRDEARNRLVMTRNDDLSPSDTPVVAV
jgi:hypothetical protein